MARPKLRRSWAHPVRALLVAGLVPVSIGGPTSPQFGPPLPGVARYEHQAVWDPVDGKAYVFGGLSRNASGDFALLRELWSFDPSANTWTDLSSSGGPSARTGCALAWDPSRSQLLVSAGSTVDASCSDDLWTYRVADATWQQRTSEPNYPFIARRYHTLTYDPSRDRFWQMSGFCIDQPYRNYVGYDAASDAWSSVYLIGGAYGYRIKHAAVWDPVRSKLLVYGGEVPAYGPSRDQLLYWQIVWSVDPGQNVWTPLPTGPVVPNRRSAFVSGYDPYLDALLVYGGITFAAIGDPNPVVTGELWAFHLDSSHWVRLDAGELPARAAAAGAYCASRGEMLAFGGTDSDPFASQTFVIHSETLRIPIESPATFKWAGNDISSERAPHRSGIVDVLAARQAIDRVRLMDARTGKEYATASTIRRLGRTRWRVTFGPASDDELNASAAGQLVISGLMVGQERAFLAPASGRNQAMATADQTVEPAATGMVAVPAVMCHREAMGWSIVVQGTAREPAAVLVVDVRGRTWARLSASLRGLGSDFLYHWSGQRDSGGGAPPGVYFVRVLGGGNVGSARLVID